MALMPNSLQKLEDANATQVGGDHYKKLAVQPWDAMQSWMTPEAFKGFLHGNVIKYIARDKGSKYQYLCKAQHYLTKLLEVMGKEPKQCVDRDDQKQDNRICPVQPEGYHPQNGFAQKELLVGDPVIVLDRYRFAIPLKGHVSMFSASNDGVEVRLSESNNPQYPISALIWVHRGQLI